MFVSIECNNSKADPRLKYENVVLTLERRLIIARHVSTYWVDNFQRTAEGAVVMADRGQTQWGMGRTQYEEGCSSWGVAV